MEGGARYAFAPSAAQRLEPVCYQLAAVAPVHWYEALMLSLSSFQGRGFFPSQFGLGDPLAIVAAFEAVLGLFIELILNATFSNRILTKG
ncbi:MAG TPA: hypothetical protein VGP82_09655 [Ktedonobacterales bacterium]|nr:hypothetical protein [Ktedonobacterales bacterium]